jgi:hypothetical protein
MRINNAKLITHTTRPSTCIIGDLVWDESHIEKWNIRENTEGQATAKPLPAPDGSQVPELP